MGIFDRKNQHSGPTPPPVITSGSSYTVQNIEKLLDEIGLMRLNVSDVQMKLLTTSVVWETKKYIDQKSAANQGQLPGIDISSLQEQLQIIKNVLFKYIDVEGNPEKYGDQATTALDQGSASLLSYVERIEASSKAGSVDLIGFNVDTKILSTHQF
jgi:hypothetical protein